MAAEFTNGRVRVNEEGAQELWLALMDRHGWLIEERAARPFLTTEFNRRLKVVRRVIAETEALFGEKAWAFPDEEITDEPQRSDETGAGAPEAAGREWGLGRRP